MLARTQPRNKSAHWAVHAHALKMMAAAMLQTQDVQLLLTFIIATISVHVAVASQPFSQETAWSPGHPKMSAQRRTDLAGTSSFPVNTSDKKSTKQQKAHDLICLLRWMDPNKNLRPWNHSKFKEWRLLQIGMIGIKSWTCLDMSGQSNRQSQLALRSKTRSTKNLGVVSIASQGTMPGLTDDGCQAFPQISHISTLFQCTVAHCET